MAVITEISPQKHDGGRVNVYLDGRFAAGLKLETAIKCKLKVGFEIDEDTLSKVQFENEKDEALDKAMSFLSRAVKTAKQVREYLEKKGYTSAVTDYALAKLDEYKYLDDGEYCRLYAENYSRTKGKRLMALELKKRGAAAEDIETALEEIDETESAAALLKKYLSGKILDLKTISKGYNYLLSKGFGYDAASEAVKKFKDGLNEDE